MASVHPRHSRKCGGHPGKVTAPGINGCTCAPRYLIASRDSNGRSKWETIGPDLKKAQLEAKRADIDISDDTRVHVRDVAFGKFAQDWLAGLELEPSTVVSYRTTVAIASELVGRKPMSKVTVADIARFNGILRKRNLVANTRRRHLNVLGSVFEAGRAAGATKNNPVRELPANQRPKGVRSHGEAFTDGEIARLLPAITSPLYRTYVQLMLETGLRPGEAAALTWGDINHEQLRIRVDKTYSDRAVRRKPKGGRWRTIDVDEATSVMLARWWGETGSPTNPKALLFKGTAKSGNISPVPALRTLRRAMEAAAVPLEGPDYGLPRNLHSCRHSFARMALEAGETITWLSNHLGHADLATTDRCYSHFSREEGKRAAARVGKRIAKLTAQTGAQTLPAATAYPAPLR